MGMKRLLFLGVVILLTIAPGAEAQELRYREEPLSIEEMKPFKNIPFTTANFEKVASGMTEEQVISILGPPTDVKKERRRHHRWTAHYFYPEGHVVNFRNGLVVGKEKK